jgi:hypothetical protein
MESPHIFPVPAVIIGLAEIPGVLVEEWSEKVGEI